MRNRTSARLAFTLRTAVMLLTAVSSLFWARALIRVMGNELYGLFLTFIAIAQLGGLGDLGISGAVGMRILHHLARGEDSDGQRLLANARGVFLALALTFAVTFVVLSPWLPAFFHFATVPRAGSLGMLFALGGLGIGLVIINGYFQSLNYAHGNVVWPILPSFIFMQAGFVLQWALARVGAPLWMQYGAGLGVSGCSVVLAWAMLRASHPWLGRLRPVRVNWVEARHLAGTSFWVYLCALGNLIYTTTDQILVNAGFGSSLVPAYRFNYKLPEFAVTLLVSASFVTLPAIVLRLLNGDESQRGHGLSGVDRLQKLEVFGACAASIGYLGINDSFIGLWQGAEFHVPLALQVAFALNLTVTIAGNTGVQLLGRLDPKAVRIAGLTIGGTGLLNLGLSFCAMKFGSLLGIAIATVIAQTVATLVMGHSVCRLLRLPWLPWVWRSWLLPVGALALAVLLRAVVAPTDGANALILASADAALLGGLAWTLGITRQMIVDEGRRFLAASR